MAEEFEKIILTGFFKSGDRWEQIPNPRLERLFDLDIASEDKADFRPHDTLEDATAIQLKNAQIEINTENESYIYEEMDRLDQFVEESLLKFRQEMDTREKEIKELQRTTRASRTLGAHERDQIQAEIDKKQKELFKAQKKYIQAQEEQFVDKDKRVADLRSKLQMNFSHERIAAINFTIIS